MENQNFLIHHGIKGQRWGVRRYQNEDGSLTAAGQKRAEKAEIKSDAKKLSKTGIPGGLKDRIHKNRGTELYSQLNQERGREYTNKVLKSARNREAAMTYVSAGIAGVAAMGLSVAGAAAFVKKNL